MKNITISIEKGEIFDRVSLNTAYVGAKSASAAAHYERVATVEADSAMLEKLWKESCSEISDRLREFISEAESGDKILRLIFEVSNSYDESVTTSLEEDLRQALATGVTARWFGFSFPERFQEWKENSETLLSRVVGKLCHRRKPVRKG